MAGDNKLSVIVETEAELSALTAYRDKLQEVRAATAASGESTKSLDSTIASLDQVVKGGVGQSFHEASSHLEVFGLRGRQAHMAIRLLSSQLGEFGHIAHYAAFAPALAGVVSLIVAMKMLQEQFDLQVKQMQEVTEWNRRMRESAIQASEEATRSMKSEVAAYDLRLKHMFDSEDQFAKAMQNRLKMYEQEQDHIKALQGLDASRFDAYIDYMARIGRITPEQADAQKTARKEREADAKENADERKAQASIDEKKKELEHDEDLMVESKDRLPSARAAAKAADAAAKKNKSDTQQKQDQYDKLDKAAKEAEDRVAIIATARRTYTDKNATGGDWWAADIAMTKLINADYAAGMMSLADYATSTPTNFVFGEGAENDQREASGLRAAAEQQKGSVEKMTDQQATLDDAKKAADAQVKMYEDETVELKKKLKELEQAISDATLALSAKKAQYAEKRADQHRADAATEFYKTGPHDQESADFSSLNGYSSAATAALSKVFNEAASRVKEARWHKTNYQMLAATLEHIHALLASNATLDENQTSQLESIMVKLQSLQSQNNNTPRN